MFQLLVSHIVYMLQCAEKVSTRQWGSSVAMELSVTVCPVLPVAALKCTTRNSPRNASTEKWLSGTFRENLSYPDPQMSRVIPFVQLLASQATLYHRYNT